MKYNLEINTETFLFLKNKLDQKRIFLLFWIQSLPERWQKIVEKTNPFSLHEVCFI